MGAQDAQQPGCSRVSPSETVSIFPGLLAILPHLIPSPPTSLTRARWCLLSATVRAQVVPCQSLPLLPGTEGKDSVACKDSVTAVSCHREKVVSLLDVFWAVGQTQR